MTARGAFIGVGVPKVEPYSEHIKSKPNDVVCLCLCACFSSFSFVSFLPHLLFRFSFYFASFEEQHSSDEAGGIYEEMSDVNNPGHSGDEDSTYEYMETTAQKKKSDSSKAVAATETKKAAVVAKPAESGYTPMAFS